MTEEKKEYEIKCYKIWYEDEPEEFYIGSTKYDRLSRRMAGHRYHANHGSKSKIYQTMRLKGINSFSYRLIASCMVTCSDEQRSFEQHWIDTLKPTLNSYRAYASVEYVKQYNKDYYHKPERKQKQKEYEQRPEWKQKQKEYRQNKKRICICGVEYVDISSKAQRHYKSEWHNEFVSGLPFFN